MNSRLQMRQSQTLGLNQQQQQSLRLLQMSAVELDQAVTEAVDGNPFLTIDDRKRDPRRVDTRTTVQRHAGASNWLNNVAAPDISLAAHLTHQADILIAPTLRPVAYAIIGAIDDTGYLSESIDALVARLGISADAAATALAAIQSFEPTGVGARSLSECLLLQAIEAGEADPAMRALLDHLPWLAEGRLVKLERVCAVDADALGELIRRVRSYDPKPGMTFAPSDHGWLSPDVIVRAGPEGWRVDLSTGTLPTVTIVKNARALKAGCDANAKTWLNDCANDARALIKAVQHRQGTLLSVAAAIVAHQNEFLHTGVAGLRPLTMREIADELGIHESTVSRAVANKSIACPRGTFELRFFFASGVAQQDGETASAMVIKNIIKSLIANEAAATILSDDALVTRLQAQGYAVARRTVAKYRESLGIGNSSERRRHRLLQGACEPARRAA